MSTALSSSSGTYENIPASPPTGCPFAQKSYLGGLYDWARHTNSFFSSERLEFVNKILSTETLDVHKDYEWAPMPHSPNSLFITDPHMIQEIVSMVRDGPILSSGLEFQHGLTYGTGSESPLTNVDPSRKHTIRKFCLREEFGEKTIEKLTSSIANVARSFVSQFKTDTVYDISSSIPHYTMQQTVENVLKAEVDIERVVSIIAKVEEDITNIMLVHVKKIIFSELTSRIAGDRCFQELAKIAQEIIEQENAEGIIHKMINSKQFTETEIQDLTQTILFIGSGTTKSAIISALYCLIRDPALQEEIYESVKDIDLTCDHREALFTVLNKHEKLNCFLLEVLRLFPPIMFQIRNTKVEYTFRCNNMKIPPNTSIYMSLLHSYHDARRWPEPNKCDPNRFKVLSEDEKAQNMVHKLNPFSIGHTKCIGEKFAKMTFKAIISAFLQAFKIVRPTDREEQHMKIVGGMTLQFDQPLYVQFEPRT